MTAREKFEARLKELGLDGEYGPDDHVGKFLEDGSIVVLVHIQSDPTDGYTEFRYPPFEEMWKDSRFREECKENFYDSDDDHFVAELAYWLDIHKNGAKCPLTPVDAYWAGAPETEWFNYEDDPSGIMDTSNSHNKSLVAQINEKWDKFKDKFEPILCALYERDIDEITDGDSFQIPAWVDTPQYRLGCSEDEWGPYMEMALRDMKDRWEDFAENYLMHIADDQDLETILTFVRFDVCEGTGRDWIKR